MAKHVKVPKEVKDRGAESVQGWMIVGGLGAGVVSFIAFSNGAPETGFWSALICAGALFIASKIKTKKDFRGGLYK